MNATAQRTNRTAKNATQHRKLPRSSNTARAGSAPAALAEGALLLKKSFGPLCAYLISTRFAPIISRYSRCLARVASAIEQKYGKA